MARDQAAGGRVRVLEPPRVAGRGEQEVVGQKRQLGRLHVLTEGVMGPKTKEKT